MNRLEKLFKEKEGKILSVYFTAGFPELHSTIEILEALEKSGANLVEIGMPFSDPLADGPVIQASSQKALQNGMTIQLLFDQLKEIRQKIKIPIILMGYLNPVLKYSLPKFLEMCKETGVDGTIIPDLPIEEYLKYRDIFESNQVSNIFLITPETSEERVRMIDQVSTSFLYLVSSSATTGKQLDVEGSTKYFQRLNSYNLKSKTMVGFGISNKTALEQAYKYSNGAIIGTAFIKSLSEGNSIKESVSGFFTKLKSN